MNTMKYIIANLGIVLQGVNRSATVEGKGQKRTHHDQAEPVSMVSFEGMLLCHDWTGLLFLLFSPF
jgi:hypothetical protein